MSSVGEIRKFTDTDGDGKADKIEVLFTGFGFARHARHVQLVHAHAGRLGLRLPRLRERQSKVKGKDGHEVADATRATRSGSGRTARRIEVFTRGQVNPFGMTVDPWFNLYTADCHSKPITQLIPGAYYDSFGKPHDGLGFAPHVTRHDHGTTGLCGLAWYDADQFPKEYHGHACSSATWSPTASTSTRSSGTGATPVAKELPDFLVSKDRWFRPVDIKLGPDGALYVADFYNKIIGHYEVDLKHPGRDKDRGRIWRIVWKGEGRREPREVPPTDFTTATDAELIDDLFHPNLTVRFLAGHQLRHRAARRGTRWPKTARRRSQRMVQQPERLSESRLACVHRSGRAGPLRRSDYEIGRESAKSAEHSVAEQLSGHLVRALGSREKWGESRAEDCCSTSSSRSITRTRRGPRSRR